MSRDFDVVIVGGGVNGLVLAGLLVARKLTMASRLALVAERFSISDPSEIKGVGVEVGWDLRVFALNRASQVLLRHCGVWDALPPNRVFAYERMCVWAAGGAAEQRGSLKFDCAEIGEANLGHIVEGRALQRQCLQAARAAGVVLIEAAIARVAMNDVAARIYLSDGRELRSQLLVAADGTESKTRELLGMGTAGHSYLQDALVAHVRTGKPHNNTAWQRFLSTGPIAFLPLPDGRSSIVWSVAREEAARLRALEPGAFGAALTAASGEALGQCELTTAVASFPLKLRYATSYAQSRAVLLGDAAHTVHPLAGQGLNMGLMDCASLVQILSEAGGVRAFGDYKVLRRYERERKSENLLMATALDGLDRLFGSAHPLSVHLGAVGLAAVDKIPLLKRQFAYRAMGLKGDLPPFLQSIQLGGANEVVLG